MRGMAALGLRGGCFPVRVGDRRPAHGRAAGEDWIVHATAVFVPDSGATTFLEELDQPRPDDSSLDPTPVPSGHLQPLPAFETRGRPLPALPAVAHARIRYRGEASAMLPLSLGVLGLIVVGRKPNRARAR